MKPLINTDSRLYRRRLVRELNALQDGFYAPYATFVVRCNRARFVYGILQCHSLSVEGEWFVPSYEAFDDVYGRNVVASRKAQ